MNQGENQQLQSHGHGDPLQGLQVQFSQQLAITKLPS